MKKLWGLLFFLFTFSLCYGQVRGPYDIIVLVDKTNLNDEVKAFVTGTFIKEQLKFGDTFHLMGFNDAVSVEISRRIMGNDDLNAIIAAGRDLRKTAVASNPAGALDFAATYVASLASARPKKVVLITNMATARNSVSEAAPQFSAIHASLEWVNLPAPSAQARPPRPDAQRAESARAEQKPPNATEPQPPPAQAAQYQPAEPPAQRAEQTPPPAAPPQSAQSVVIQAPEEENNAPTTEESPTAPSAPQKPKIITPESPASSILQIRPKTVFRMPQLSPVIVTLVLAVFFCMTLAFTLLCKRTLQSLDRTFFLICSQKAVEPAFLSLFVEDQNTNIGRRNMHTISAGWSLTIGGGASDFLIFLVPMPQNIAKIRFDGNECVFIPQKKQFFPELNDKMAPDCAGKTIKIRSNRNYDLFIRIMRHEAPYKKLSALFQSIKLPAQFSRM
ncbi:MAG: hypothetical protein LBK73_13455 [Treponema sp.]|nr:hypothetical protein [Treponema sp.]